MPPNAVKLLAGVDHKNMGYFCYADVAWTDPEYALFFRDKEYVVLDCPVMEKGMLLNPKELRTVIEIVRPTFTIIPDKVFDKNITLAMFWQYCEYCADQSLTGVLQGRSRKELIECAEEMLQGGVRRLAIPRVSDSNGAFLRSELLKELHDRWPLVQWHLLGANYPYSDDMASAQIAMSCDSAEAVNCAIQGAYLQLEYIKRPADFLQLKSEQLDNAYLPHNIVTLCKWFERGQLS